MPLPWKIETDLTADELEQLRAFLRERRRTVDEAHEWLLARGYTISRSAVGGWLAKERAESAAEAMRHSSSISRAMMDAARDEGALGVQDVAVLQLGNAITETLIDLQAGGTLDVEQLATLALAAQRVTYSKRQIETVRSKVREELKAEQEAALAKAEASVTKDANPASVINTVRSLLGIATAPPATPAPAGGGTP